MIDIKISLAVGAALMIGGGALFRWHRDVWRSHSRVSRHSETDWRFYRTQYRRRLQIAILLVLLGILIPLADYVIFQKSPRVFTALACGILFASGWIMILAALDWLSQQSFLRGVRNREASQARRLRAALDESREQSPPRSREDPPAEEF